MSSFKISSLNLSTILSIVKTQLGSQESQTAVLRETTAFGVPSTITFPAETDNIRVSRNINNIQYNTLGITVESPNFTIPGSGTFEIVARANFSATWQVVTTSGSWGVVKSRLYLRNETDNLNDVLIGDSCFGEQMQIDVNSRVLPTQGVAPLTGVFTQSKTTTYSLQQICNTQFQNVRIPPLYPAKSGGTPISTSSTDPEYYVNVKITKISTST